MDILDKIIKKCDKYDLVAEYVNENTLKVYSKKYLFDTWLIKIEKNKVNLYHNSKKYNNQKCSYHLQNSYNLHKWFWSVKKIVEHNDYVINKKNYKRTDWISDVLNNHSKSLRIENVS